MESTLLTAGRNVTEKARERLKCSPYYAVRSLSCDFDGGVLRLRGRLTSFYHKQVAQEAVAGIIGVSEVVNEIDVVPLPRNLPWPDERRFA
jgi:hypothetical protein